MKAIAFSKYGTTKDLAYKEVQKPTPKEGEVLVRIKAASVNDWDWGLLRGQPFVNRMIFGLLKPKVKTLGLDIAGTVESIGEKVSGFKAGDNVFGDISNKVWGGFAEYVSVSADALVAMPEKMSFKEAAAIPQAGVLALQGFIDKWKVQPGQHVLINGGGGGCGTFAIQIAKNLGAQVTAVDKGSKFDIMQSMGADHLIDYTQEDFTQNENTYDYILDFAGHHPLLDYKKALRKNGQYLLVGGASGLIIKCMLAAPFISMFSGKKLQILPHEPNKHMQKLISLYEEGTLKPVLDKSFSLQDVPKALEYFGQGICKGKIIVSIGKMLLPAQILLYYQSLRCGVFIPFNFYKVEAFLK